MTSGKLVLVGRVAGAFGVRGEVRLAAYTQDPLALLHYRNLKREDGSPALTLTAARAAKAGEIVGRAVEIATKEEADALRGLRLYAPRDAFPDPEDDDEFYLADLIGLAAFSPEGEALGVVKAVHNHGAGDILELDPGQARPTRLIPFTREAVPDVNIQEGRITVAPPVETGEPEVDGAG